LPARGGANGIIHATNCNMTDIPFTSDRRTRWIFLSPHLDDAVFSCGGLISYLAVKGIKVEIWTVFSDQTEEVSSLTPFAQALHSRWQVGDYPYKARKEEDEQACQLIGARLEHFGFQDCIYRRFPGTNEAVITSDDDLLGPIKEGEFELVDQVTEELKYRLEEPSIWVCPSAMGGHVDHRIVRIAAQKVRKLLLYYADLPYAFSVPPQIIPGMIQFSLDIPVENQAIWMRSVMKYASQISTFWKDEPEMVGQYSSFLNLYNGLPLWLPKPV
jgi:LmbE family N-acetylglucosaminyl deacetylase